MSHRTRYDAGTGTQYYIEACVNWEEHPRISEEVAEQHDHYPEQNLAATQYRHNGRVWQCGGEYWDECTKDVWTLQAVVRKSAWCDVGDAEDGSLAFRFSCDTHPSREMELQVGRPDVSLTDRFTPKHNLPFQLR